MTRNSAVLERKEILKRKPSLTTVCKMMAKQFSEKYVLPYSNELGRVVCGQWALMDNWVCTSDLRIIRIQNVLLLHRIRNPCVIFVMSLDNSWLVAPWNAQCISFQIVINRIRAHNSMKELLYELHICHCLWIILQIQRNFDTCFISQKPSVFHLTSAVEAYLSI